MGIGRRYCVRGLRERIFRLFFCLCTFPVRSSFQLSFNLSDITVLLHREFVITLSTPGQQKFIAAFSAHQATHPFGKVKPMTHLLTDEQIQQFILDGYITVQANESPDLHREVYKHLETVYEEEGNIGNNILPRIPQIQQVFDQPVVRGALTSLLGPDYILNPHRHGHLNPAGSKGQAWHKDCYVYDHNIRHPRFHWVLAFYYPQDTTEAMGPSGIIPGKQHYKTISDVDPEKTEEAAHAICGPAGTVALIHFDSWHRATPNISDKKRYMLKFQFARLHEPQEPDWTHIRRDWTPSEQHANPEVSLDVWHWLCGQRDDRLPISNVDEKGLFDADEKVRLNTAYQLAADESSVPLLIGAMRQETLNAVNETTAKTTDNAHGTNPTAGAAARALSTMGATAIPALLETLHDGHWWVRAMSADVIARIGAEAQTADAALIETLTDDHWWVRRNALEALRALSEVPMAAVPRIIQTLHDPDYRVRRNAALALCRVGEAGDPAVPDLVQMLEEENRYNRFYAALALRRIGTVQAQDAVMDALFTARWCPVTTPGSRY
jgi:hypothetical protein